MKTQTIRATVTAGHGVASGKADDPRYPKGTLGQQWPLFEAAGIPLDGLFPGTLNLSVAPQTFQLIKPRYTLSGVSWSDHHPPEDFFFSPCRIIFEDIPYSALLYIPSPETKAEHFQTPDVLEVLAPLIEGITYGATVRLEVRSEEIMVFIEEIGLDP